MIKPSLILIPLLILPWLLYSCNSPTSVGEINLQTVEPPLITGIIRTSPDSPTPLAIYGVPNEQPEIIEEVSQNIKSQFFMASPYPNPTEVATAITFGLPVARNVTVWVVKGRLPGENVSDNTIVANGNFASPKFHYYKVLEKKFLRAGYYSLTWDAKYDNGDTLPDGVYRIYIEIDGQLMWRNVMIFHQAFTENPGVTDLFK